MPIFAEELDQIARLGLDDLRNFYGSKPPQGTKERAEFTLKLIAKATSLKNSEINQVVTVLKVGKAAGVPPQDYSWLWRQIASSGRVALKEAEPPVIAQDETKGKN